MTSSERPLPSLFDLTGRVALLTGGTGHLGPSMAEALAEAGATVLLTSRDARKAHSVARDLPHAESAGHRGFAFDQTVPQAAMSCLAEAVRVGGEVDILVCNAHDADPLDWRGSRGERFEAAARQGGCLFELARGVRNSAVQRKAAASIVFVGSMYGTVGSYPDVYEGIAPINPPTYQFLKAGMIQLTRHLAVCWGRDGVRVNCLSPGPFPSPAVNETLKERLRTRSPLGRLGSPDELKGALLFLASDASSYVTGQNLLVDGGWTAW